MRLLRLVWRNLRRSSRRTLLTALTVALSTFIFVLLISIPGSIDRIVQDSSRTLRLIVINRSLPFYGIPARYCDAVKQMQGAVACVAITGWPATYRDVSDQVFAVAEGLEIGDVFPDYDLSGEARRAFARERRGAFVGRVLMDQYHWRAGQQVTLRGADASHLELSFIILGTVASQRYPNIFAFRRDYLEEARRAAGVPGADLAWTLAVRVASAEDLPRVMHQIDETFRNSDFETRTLTESDALAGGLSALGDVSAIVFTLAAVVVLTVLLIEANSTAMMVRERTGEVAVMRTLGFSRGAVAVMLFAECGAIGLLGGTVGAGAAYWLFHQGVALAALIGSFGALWVTWSAAALALAVAIAVGLLSGLLSILATLRTPPAIALRQVG
jgi:putative ABC transport system permease protein